MELRSYSPSNVIVTIASASDGQGTIATFDKVDVEYNEERWGFETSATGHITRTRRESVLGKISIDVPQTSVDNDVIMDMSITQLVAGEVGPIPTKFTLSITDNWGQSMYTMTDATLVQPQGSSFSKDPNNRTWEFQGKLDVPAFVTRGENHV